MSPQVLVRQDLLIDVSGHRPAHQAWNAHAVQQHAEQAGLQMSNQRSFQSCGSERADMGHRLVAGFAEMADQGLSGEDLPPICCGAILRSVHTWREALERPPACSTCTALIAWRCPWLSAASARPLRRTSRSPDRRQTRTLKRPS